jgi:hypothetical protein
MREGEEGQVRLRPGGQRRLRHLPVGATRLALLAFALLLLTGCGELVATIPLSAAQAEAEAQVDLPPGVVIRFPAALDYHEGPDTSLLLHAELRREGLQVAGVDCTAANLEGSGHKLWESQLGCRVAVPEGGADAVFVSTRLANPAHRVDGLEIQVRVRSDITVEPGAEGPPPALGPLEIAGIVVGVVLVLGFNVVILVFILRKRSKLKDRLAYAEALSGEPWELRFEPRKARRLNLYLRYRMRGEGFRPGLTCAVTVEVHGREIARELVGVGRGAATPGVTRVPTVTWFSSKSNTTAGGTVALLELGLCRPGFQGVARGTLEPIEGSELMTLEVFVADA